MNNNLNGISNNIEPEKSNKGVKVLLIVVAILLLALLLLLGYKFLILDKKDTTNNNDDNNKVVENNNKIEEQQSNKSLVLKLDINDKDVQRYFSYVSSNEKNWPGTDFDFLNNNKNENAYRLIESSKLKVEKCKTYAKKIDHTNALTGAFGCMYIENDGTYCSKDNNELDSTKVSVLKEEDLKNAVETIYGKGAYVAENFKLDATNHYQYFADKKEYILLGNCGGGIGAMYESRLVSAQKNNNYIYLYEEIKDEENNVTLAKHTFEKNTYNNDYHYVKSEASN